MWLFHSVSPWLALHGALLPHERRENLVEAVLHLGVRQRSIRRLEGQPNRDAHFAVGHALAPIAIEEGDRGERRSGGAAGRLNGATNDLRRQAVCNDDG